MEVESMDDIRSAMTRLEDLGYIARLDERLGRGRPAERYAANPILFSGAMSQEPVNRRMELSPAGDGDIAPWPPRPTSPSASSVSQADEPLWPEEPPAMEHSEAYTMLFGQDDA